MLLCIEGGSRPDHKIQTDHLVGFNFIVGITVWALHCVQCKVRNQVDLRSNAHANRYGLRAAGTLCRASESCRHAALLLCIEGEVAPTRSLRS